MLKTQETQGFHNRLVRILIIDGAGSVKMLRTLLNMQNFSTVSCGCFKEAVHHRRYRDFQQFRYRINEKGKITLQTHHYLSTK